MFVWRGSEGGGGLVGSIKGEAIEGKGSVFCGNGIRGSVEGS